jgi:hypothetical protein
MVEHPALGLIYSLFFPEPLDFLLQNSRVHDLLAAVPPTGCPLALMDRYRSRAVVLIE